MSRFPECVGDFIIWNGSNAIKARIAAKEKKSKLTD